MKYPSQLCLRLDFKQKPATKMLRSLKRFLSKSKSCVVTQGENTRGGAGVEYDFKDLYEQYGNKVVITLHRVNES